MSEIARPLPRQAAGGRHRALNPMNTPFSTTLAMLAALGLAATTPVVAQSSRDDARSPRDANRSRERSASAESTDLTRRVHIASINAENRSLRQYAGQQLWNTEGADLGTIKDFLVQASSGSVRYAVVSTGGVLGMGNSLRLVPVESLQVSDDHRRIAVDIQQARWLQIPPVSDEVYVADRFEISPAQHDQMLWPFGDRNRAPSAGESRASADREAQFAGLVRATTLRGKSVRAEGQPVGQIENIILDLERGTAAALLDANGSFTGTAAKYLVPLNQLKFEYPGQDPISTSLTRADFDRARPSNYGLAQVGEEADPRAANAPDNDALEPTGRTQPAKDARRSAAPAEASVRAVEQALQNDPDLAVENVFVSSEDGKVILRGSVRNQAIKGRLEAAARRAVPAATVDSEIIIGNR